MSNLPNRPAYPGGYQARPRSRSPPRGSWGPPPSSHRYDDRHAQDYPASYSSSSGSYAARDNGSYYDRPREPYPYPRRSRSRSPARQGWDRPANNERQEDPYADEERIPPPRRYDHEAYQGESLQLANSYGGWAKRPTVVINSRTTKAKRVPADCRHGNDQRHG